MTIGDIKVEALRLMHVDREVSCENLDELLYDDNLSDLVRAMGGAINRCLSDLTVRLVLPPRRVALTGGEGRGGWRRFSLEVIGDMFAPARLTAECDEGVRDVMGFVLEDDTLRVDEYDEDASYYLFYHPRLPRVSDATANTTELSLPPELAEAVPWFVVSEVWRADEPDEADKARSNYETAVLRYVESRLSPVRQTVVDNMFGGLR